MSQVDTTAEAVGDHDEDHPTPRLYVTIALVLSVLTAMEFSTYFIEFGWLHLPLLLTMMAIKFALIVGYFMHLKYDTGLFSRLAFGGLSAALILYAGAILAILEVPGISQ